MDQPTRPLRDKRRPQHGRQPVPSRHGLSGHWLVAAVLTQSIVANAAVAEQATASPQDCRPKIEAHHTVTHQTGPHSFNLDDGSEIVLAGLLVATVHDANTDIEHWPPQHDALEAIKRLTLGASIAIARVNPARDRYGRLRSHAFLLRNRSEQWLQALLLEQGHARLDPEQLSRACTKPLLAAETRARLAGRGLWQHAAYQIRRAEQPRMLIRYRNSFQIVEGTVRRVSHTSSRSFINFGPNWRTDFTAGIATNLARRAMIDGVRLTSLAGRPVRIRGWIRQRGGPFIAVRALSQIELLSRHETARHRRRANRTRRRPGLQIRKTPGQKSAGR